MTFPGPTKKMDPTVDNMVKLINEGFEFENKMFKGGITSTDLQKLRGHKQKGKQPKHKQVPADFDDHIKEGDVIILDINNYINYSYS